MEHPTLRHRSFSNLPLEVQSDILYRINSRLAIQKIRSVSREFRHILPVEPPHQHLDMVIPFFNNNGDVLSTANLRTYDVYNCRDGKWIIQLDYNLQEEDGQSVGLMHPLTESDFEPDFDHPPRIFDPVRYDTIEMPSSYRLTANVNATEYREIAFRPESIWTLLDDFMILIIWREGRLALYRSMDQTWGFIQHVCVDVICFDRHFYALESSGRTFMVHADRTTEEVAGPIIGENGHKKRLVESGGDLLLVDQYYRNPNEEDVNQRRTSRFVVFRFVNEENTWVRIHTLGERVLFLGYYNRFSAAVVDVAGARGDLIYFAEAFAIEVDLDPPSDDAEDEDFDEDEDGDEDEGEDSNDDGNEDVKEDIHGPGSKDEGEDEDEEGGENGNEDEGEDGNGDEEGGGIHGPGRDDVGIFDMVDGRITKLGDPAAAQFAACFWPPPAWTANAAV